jgi:hypothetical protein
VSWFTTPTDLEARVSAAVTMAGLTRQLDLQPATALPPNTGVAGDSSAEHGIRQAIIAAGDHQRALKIDLATTWWSTRLYLIASLAQRLTQARRILVVDTTKSDAVSAGAGVAPPVLCNPPRSDSLGSSQPAQYCPPIGPKVPALGIFAQWLQARPIGYNQGACRGS